MEKIGIFFLLLAAPTLTKGADKMVTVGDVTVKVLQTSGSIRVYTWTDDTNGVQITHKYLKEFDADGVEIDSSHSHSFEAFDTLTFTLGEIETTTFGPNNVAVKKFTARATTNIVGQPITFALAIYVFTEDGSISVDGSDVVVKSGDVKFDVKISLWPFCDEIYKCEKEGSPPSTGAFLDFGFEVKGKGDSTPANKNGNVYELGTDNKIIMPKKVTIDGETPADMPTDYPKLETMGNKELFVVRFDSFTDYAKYEPIIMTETSGNPDEGGSGDNPDDTSTPDATELSKTVSQSGVDATVLKASGRMTFVDGTEQIVVSFTSITEVNDDDGEIQTAGHKYESFTNQQFTTGNIEEETLQNLDVKRMTFTSTLGNDAVIIVHLYLVKEAGTITNGDEMVNVTAGNAMFSIELSGWKFCGDSGVTCSHEGADEIGSHLDIAITAQGEKSSPEMKTVEDAGKVYDLGSGLINLFTQYSRDEDNTKTSMPTGYPSNEDLVFTMRFDKFATSIMSDVVVMLASDDEDNSSATAHVSLLSVLFMMIVHIVKQLLY